MFKKGESGNVNGRPPGTSHGATLRRAIESRSTELIEKLIEQALAGDTSASGLLLNRILPALKPQALPVSVTTPDNAGLTAQGTAIITATLNGDIPPDIGSQLVTALSGLAKLNEVDGILQRLDRLETVA